MDIDDHFESLFPEDVWQAVDDTFTSYTLGSASSQNSTTPATACFDFVDSDDEMLGDDSAQSPNLHLVSFSREPISKSYNTTRGGSVELSNSDGRETGLFNKAQSSLPFLTNSNSSRNCEDYLQDVNTTGVQSVSSRIENIFQSILADLQQGKGIEIMLRQRRRVYSNEPNPRPMARRLCFPGRSAEDAWRFTVVLRLLELIYNALSTGITLSKRDLYYRDPALFGSQTHVDRYVDDIAFTFGVPRSALNVTAVAKGLIAGAVMINRRDGSRADASRDREGLLVPNLKDVLSVEINAAQWILVVEKEASFRSLAASPYWSSLSSEGILLTGKGYPDIATRAMLRFLSLPSPRNGFAAPLVFGLADFDPDGLAILSTYRDGSLTLAHENEQLSVPELRRLGLTSQHLSLAAENDLAAQGVLALTARDRHKARKMLERRTGDSVTDIDRARHGYDQSRELQRMLILNVKAELQLLDAVPNAISMVLNQLPRATT